MEKKGAAHVEIILSFVLFVGFTYFLLNYLQPSGSNYLEDSILISLKDRFFENTSTNLTIALVNYSVEICQPSELSENSISVDIGRIGYYYVYSSSEFIDALNPCVLANYKLGFVDREGVISNASLKNIESLYVSNYDSLKTEFGIPANVDFGLVIPGYSFPKQIPDNTKVVAGSYKKKILYANGTSVNTDFIFKIW